MIPLLLYLWPIAGGGKALLIRTFGGVTGLAKHERCCCTESDGCCGRLLPGPDSNEGVDYYPLVIHGRLTRGSCAAPDPAVEFDLTWDTGDLIWKVNGVDMGNGTTADFTATCEGFGGGNWVGALAWGICTCNEALGRCTFDFEETLTDGECNPLDLTATETMVGLMCCGSLGGGTVTFEVWE